MSPPHSTSDQYGASDKYAASEQSFSILDSIDGEGIVLIGKGTTIHGKIGDCQKVEVQGRLEGDLYADVVLVREGGSISGKLHAARAEIHGSVEGEVVVAELLDVRTTGQLAGDLQYGRLAVAVGAQISGTLYTQHGQSKHAHAEPQHARGATELPPLGHRGTADDGSQQRAATNDDYAMTDTASAHHAHGGQHDDRIQALRSIDDRNGEARPHVVNGSSASHYHSRED